MRVPRTTVPPPDYSGLINTIAGQITGLMAVETPQLGRVEFLPPKDALAAIYTLQMLQAQASGIPATGVFVATYNRGLGCPSNGGCC